MKGFVEKLNKVLEVILGMIGIAMILIQTYAVFARNVLQVASPWTDEALKLLFVWTIFTGAAMAFYIDDAICLTLVEDSKMVKSRPAVYGIMKIIQFAGATAVALFMMWHLRTIIGTQMSTGEATTVLKYPLWIMNSGIMVGMIFTVFYGVIKLIDCKKYFVKQ